MARDIYSKTWITENSIKIIERYEVGMLTLRALHYQLVAIGMINSLQHYKRVVSAMIDARWDDIVSFDTFSDHDRAILGETSFKETTLTDEIRGTKRSIQYWMENYNKNRWENQPNYPEVWIEKKALQGVFEPPCNDMDIALAPCKGYPSLTFLNDALKRFQAADEIGKKPIILYFGDYDASGEDIPRSIAENFLKMGLYVEVRRIALTEAQVVEMGLSPAPTKVGDSRAKNWDGLGQVELDAVELRQLQRMCAEAIESVFDEDLYSELMGTEEEEREQYRKEIKEFVQSL